MILQIGDTVKDKVGDLGTVRRLGPPRVQNHETYIFADPKAEGPTFQQGADTALVAWKTVDGKPVFEQCSWEDVSDLTKG